MTKHTILFLAANPQATDRLQLSQEARAIQKELVQAAGEQADALEYCSLLRFEQCPALAKDDLLRELRRLRPAIVHFSCHGGPSGLYFQAANGASEPVTREAIAEVFGAVGSVRLAVLNACYTDEHADALLAHVDCVIGMSGAIPDQAAYEFAKGFYGALVRESVATAYKQGVAAMGITESAAGTRRDFEDDPREPTTSEAVRPQLRTRPGVDPAQLLFAPPRGPLPCPYPGLEAFGPEQATRFFGRKRQIKELTEQMNNGVKMTCVVGPSGSGKSSFVRAGVLSSRNNEQAARWSTVTLRPGSDPMAALRRALGSDDATIAHLTGDRVIVFVDQLEELFTTASAASRDELARALRALGRDERCRVVCALRADFYGALIESELWDDFALGVFEIAPLRGKDLRDAIVCPAEASGVTFDEQLVGKLVLETEAAPSGLPLLQATLQDLWDFADDRTRTLGPAHYEQLGPDGIGAALARRANGALATLSVEQHVIARRIFLSLLAFGVGRSHTRRQRLVSELETLGNEVELHSTLDVIIQKRLVTASRGPSGTTIELSHEALITAWPTMREWIEQGRVDEERRRALERKVTEWLDVRERDPESKLLDAVELLDAESFVKDVAVRVGAVRHLDELIDCSRSALETIRRQRDEAHRLVAMSYQERGRQLLTSDRPMAALPYLVASRLRSPQAVAPAALQMLFSVAARSAPALVIDQHAAINCLVLAHDGTCVAAGCSDGRARIWDLVAGRELKTVDHGSAILALAFDREGARLATAGADGYARIWRVSSGEQLVEVKHDKPVHIVELSSDGSTLLTACWDLSVRLFDAATGSLRCQPLQCTTKIKDARFSADGRQLAIAAGNDARIHDASTGQLLHVIAHEDLVRSVSFDGTGARLATASSDRTARVTVLASAEHSKLEHPASVGSAELTCEGDRVLTTSEAKARVWVAASGEPASDWIEHDAHISAAAWTDGHKTIVTASFDRTVRVWDAVSGRAIASPFEHAREVTALAIDPMGKRVLTACTDTVLRVWNLDAVRAKDIKFAHAKRWIEKVAVQPNGPLFATAGTDHTARLWNPLTQECRELRHDDREVKAVTFAARGDRLATICGTTVSIWSCATGDLVTKCVHRDVVATAQFDGDGTKLATAGRDGVLRVWDIQAHGADVVEHRHPKALTGAWFGRDQAILTACADGYARVLSGDRVLTLDRHGDTVSHAAFAPKGDWIATASRDGTARIWNATTGACMAEMRHAGEVQRVSFSSDGTRLLTMSNRSVRIWDVPSGRAALDGLDHRSRVRAARFAPDNALIATGTEDGAVSIWDAGTGRAIMPPLLHAGRVNDLAFSNDGTWLVTASGDRYARMWRLGYDDRDLAEWERVAESCPYTLDGDVLVERAKP